MNENENNTGESSSGRTLVFETSDLGSNPSSPSKFDRKAYMREYQKEWYKKNRQKTMQRSDKYRKELREWFRELVSKLSCIKCDENHPGCLDFHHRDPNVKDDQIADMVANKRTKKAILEEIEKCDVLCSNCHRKLHYEERK